MTNRCVRELFCIALLLALGTPAAVTLAADTENHQIIGGVRIYFGMMPAEMMQAHPKEHVERSMHGGIPSGGHRDHLVVALFDNATGERIGNARVAATVSEAGLSSETKSLEPMKIAGTITYGNYFDLPSDSAYSIVLRVKRPGVSGTIDAKFVHRHYRR